MIEHTTATLATYEQRLPADITTPLPILSSNALGWSDITAHVYLAPMQGEDWVEPVTSDVTVMLLMRGAMRLEQQANPNACGGFHLQRGDLLLKPANIVVPVVRWRSLSTEPIYMLYVQLRSAVLRRIIEELADRDLSHIELIGQAGFHDPLLLQIGLALGQELESPSTIGPLYAQAAAHMLAAHLLRHYTVAPIDMREPRQGLTPQHIQRVTEYVQAHLTQPLSLADLAQQTGFSPYHFARLFRQTTGDSPYQFVLRQRVAHAQRLLSHTDNPIAQVALESGFAHQSHLTQAFKRYTGATPKAFRQGRANRAQS